MAADFAAWPIFFDFFAAPLQRIRINNLLDFSQPIQSATGWAFQPPWSCALRRTFGIRRSPSGNR